MTVARHYIMHAKEGMDATLETALRAIADAVRPLPGCEGVEMLRDLGNERRFVLIERWADVDAHKAAGAMLDKGLIAPMMAALDGPPDGAYLDYLIR
ncbi:MULTISPECIES: putative quinol monooxygenase [Sphingobium]|uniref:Antibiotic biosynthesis monooxygenase n=1 Tax=Sphingobium chungbukense TaxID=56193 RepID=A0A0M3ARH9_9SPHN|nr:MULTISPECIES: antibiotic biosynthesis monooxygenase family protein [Sphingobium]KKW92523.1 antibiotic biosynthesis monooxygenase [Sphingobium chungbukense]PJG49382.1 antibiotic biosynthesis monooxygenase [Sphingobium sp. LB126]